MFLSVAFLLFWICFGTFSYVLIEEWPLLDGLYMSFITLTTIGFSETHALSDSGRIFTIFFAFIGIGIAAFGAARVAQILILATSIRKRRLARMIRRMRDHYIICGYGRIGRRVVRDLQAAGKRLVVLERNPDIIQELHEEGIPYKEGDATHENTLLAAGITHAKGLITLLPEDAVNVFVTLLGRDLNAGLFILARTAHDSNRRRLIQAGATQVVAPTSIGAIRMAQVILRPRVDEFLTHVLKADDSGLIMDEVLVEPGSFLAGQTLASSRFRQHFETIVLTVVDGKTGDMRFNPGPHETISTGDILIVLGSRAMVSALATKGCAPIAAHEGPPPITDASST